MLIGTGAHADAQPDHTLAGIEAMAMLSKGRVYAVPSDDIPGQRVFVDQVFGLSA